MLVMGIVNATPDSFSDGGAYDPVERALELARDGADWIDIGGESTRPGATPLDEAEEYRRVVPVVEAVRAGCAAPISIDTRKPAIARAAIAAGATMWNDVSGLRSSEALVTCADFGCEVVVMHMRGLPATMQDSPTYEDVLAEVTDYLVRRANAAMTAGVAKEKIWLDPGIGFGKTTAHSLTLLAHLDRIVALGFPVLVGASRKGFMREATRHAQTAADRLAGSLSVALAARRAGVAMIRVHDVKETVQALDMAEAIERHV